MKFLHKQIFVLSLFVFSTATNYCMQKNLELKPYEPNTIENIKKQHDNFITILNYEQKIDFCDFLNKQGQMSFYMIYSQKDDFNKTYTANCLFGHTALSAVLLNPHIERAKKINCIQKIRHKYFQKRGPAPRDLQFAELELYERRYALKDKIMRLYEAKPRIEHITQQLFPHEIMRNIGILMLDTEKSLL